MRRGWDANEDISVSLLHVCLIFLYMSIGALLLYFDRSYTIEMVDNNR